MRIRRIAGADTELAVTDLGPPGAPAALLAHGVGSTSRFLVEAFAEPLRSAGWRLLALDLRGHGNSTPVSDPERLTLDHHVADLATVVARFDPDLVGGVSLGGHVAVAWAAAAGDDRPVLACLPAWTGVAEAGHGPHAAVAAQVRTLGLPAMLAALGTDTTMPAWLREVLCRDWPTHDPASLAAALLALDGGRAPTLADVATLRGPLAVVGWPDDPGHPLAVAEAWAAAAAHAWLEATSLAAMQDDRTALGRAAVRALAHLGVQQVNGSSPPP